MKKFFLVACLLVATIINSKNIDFSLKYAGEHMQATIDGDSQSLKLMGKNIGAHVDIDNSQENAVQFDVQVVRDEKVVSEPVMKVAWGQAGALELVDKDDNRVVISVQANK